MPASEELARFGSELDRLVQTLWTWSPARWTDPRIAAARRFCLELIGLTALAGSPPGTEAELPVVGPHAIADQIAVLGHDLLAAPSAERIASEALEHLAATRTRLE